MNHFYRTLTLVLCFLAVNAWADSPPIKTDFFTTCADRTASNTTQCIAGNNQGLNYGGYILLQGYNYHYRLENGRFQEFLDGTASLTGQWINVSNSNIRFDVDIHLSGRTSNSGVNPKGHHCLNPDINGFYFYTHTSGTLTGQNHIAGAKIRVGRYAEPFQVGVGANVTHNQLTFGASGWLMLTLESQPNNGSLTLLSGGNGQNGDININLSGNAGACLSNPGDISLNCPNDITVTASSDNGTTVTYTTPNATTTCMVDAGTNCGTISNNISGFKYLGEYNGSKYFCSNTSDFTWHEAQHSAMMNGGHLATICSESENEYIRSRLLNEDAWIGYTDEAIEGDFKWVNGETCTFTKWRSGEPNNSRENEHFTRLLRDENGQWTDRNAEYTTEFVMEIPCQNDMQPGDVTVTRTAGPASGANFSVGMTTITYEAVDECGNTETCSFKVTVNPPVDPCAGDNSPVVQVEVTNPDCGQSNGEIKFTFGNNANRTNIEFSLNGGSTFPLDVSDNIGMTMFSNLAKGNYDLAVRWGNGECPVDLGNVSLADGSVAPGTACNDGNPNTDNDVIQSDGCTCIGVVLDPCAAKGGDADNDGVCRDDDCNDFNPNIGARQPVGTACDDGNPNTVNDEIQGDGCGCFGLPKGAISLSCVLDQTVTLASGQTTMIVSFGQPSASTTCPLGGMSITQTAGPASGSAFPEGMTTITYTVTDACGNEESCSFKITVNPVPTGDITLVCNSDITVTATPGENGAVVDFNDINASTTCSLGGLTTTQTNGLSSGSVFPVGVTTVRYTATDACGSSETCSFNVTVNPAPTGEITFACNEDIMVTAEAGATGAVVNFNDPTATTTCSLGGVSIQLASGLASGSTFPIGRTMVTYIATDACGATATCSFKITVEETVVSTKAKVGNFVFMDDNGNGIQDDGEVGLGGIFIVLKNQVTNAVKFMVTEANGMYMFSDLDAGTYTLKFVGQPTGLIGSNPNQGTDPTKDSDFNPVNGTTDPFTLAEGETNLDIDAGFRPEDIVVPDPATIGNVVFNDENGNAFFDNGEAGIPGVTVKLQNENGTTLQETQTDGNGNYQFTVSAGTYKIMFNTPTGFESIVQTGNAGDGVDNDNDLVAATGMTNVFTIGEGETNNTIDAGFATQAAICDVDAGTLSPDASPVTIVAGQAPISATPNGNEVVPTGYSKIYVLTAGTGLVIKQTNSSPVFTVDAIGKYTIHTLIYDPSTLDLGIVIPDLTTGFDVNSILIQGGGTICGALDVVGAMIMVENPVSSCQGNVTDGGQIGADEDPSACGAFDPAAMNTVVAASGGVGEIEYIWLASTVGCPTELTDQVLGATGESYDPGTISETTYFVRCARRVGCEVWIESNCVVKTVDACGTGGDCSTIAVSTSDGKITVDGLLSEIVAVKVYDLDNGWAEVFKCFNDCDVPTQMIDVPNGNYRVQVQFYSASWQYLCEENVDVQVGGSGCTDADGDGVCQADDCNDNDASVGAKQAQGTTCDDGDANTDNDQIQADGCTCRGTTVGGGDPDCNTVNLEVDAGKIKITGLDAPIVAVKIFDKNAGWSTIHDCFNNCDVPMLMVDANPSDYNVLVQFYDASWQRICEVRFDITVGGTGCTDADGDGVCQADDCNDNDANIGAKQAAGTSCDDGNPNTHNDQIQADGCSCVGTPITTDPCEFLGGDADNDGICRDNDCDDNNASIGAKQAAGTACNDGNPNTNNDQIQPDGCTCAGTPDTGGEPDCNTVSVTTGDGKITVAGLEAPIVALKIFDKNAGWSTIHDCFNNCDVPVQMVNANPGDYQIAVQFYTANWQQICEVRFDVTVGGTGCTDADGDGVCQADDCNDNDATIGAKQAVGTSCDDGDANTVNDQIQVDGCSCQGTPIGSGPDCNNVVITTEPGKLKISNLEAPIVAINILDKNAGYGSVFSCFNSCDVPMHMLDLPASDYLVKVEFYTSSWVPICRKEFDVTVPGGVDPCAALGGDADNDGVCANNDCDDGNPNIGATQPQGTSCDDGNADTENDVIQADGCSCAGTPVGPQKCANRTVSNTVHCNSGNSDYGFYLVHETLERRYTIHDGLFMEFTDGTAMFIGRITNSGDAQIGFDVNLTLTGRTTNSPTGAAKEHNCLTPDTNDFYYYADVFGTLTGTGKAEGALLTVQDHAQAFQLGNGANVTNSVLSFGASGWLTINVQSEPSGDLSLGILTGSNGNNGDININLSGDGTECPYGASSREGGNNFITDDISIYPNPAQEELFIDVTVHAGKKGNIQIFNQFGQAMKALDYEKIPSDMIKIDLDNFTNGMYYISINLEHSQTISKKILVNRLY